jgi:hypothetical protein
MISPSPDFPLGKLIKRFASQNDTHSVFGVILYTEAHPYVIKVLRDDDLWKALHAASGPRWPIFCIRPHQGKRTVRPPSGPDGCVYKMVPIPEWHEPYENDKLLSKFRLEDTSELPLLMIFALGPDGEALQVAFKISGETKDQCFQSIRGAVDAAAEAIRNISKENIKNTREVFNLMEQAIVQRIWFQRIKKGLSFAKFMKSVMSLLAE